jgi:hypothetical protein
MDLQYSPCYWQSQVTMRFTAEATFRALMYTFVSVLAEREVRLRFLKGGSGCRRGCVHETSMAPRRIQCRQNTLP